MKRQLSLFLLFACLTVPITWQLAAEEDAAFAALQAEAQKSFKEGVQPFVKKYCTECHGNRKKKAKTNGAR